MRILADTHLLLWAAAEPERLSSYAQTVLDDAQNEILFSTASVWETSIKSSQRRPDFPVSPSSWRRNLLDVGYRELLITSEHVLAVASLPAIHRDPFDRLLAAQAQVEGLLLITSDATLARYPGVRLV